MDLVTGCLEPVDRLGVLEPHDRAVGVSGEQDARFLEALPQGPDVEGQSPGRDAQTLARRDVVESVHHLDVFGTAVGRIDPTAGEDVEASGEHRSHGATEHEHLEPVVAVAYEHHGRRITDRFGPRVEAVGEGRHGSSSPRGGTSSRADVS